MLCTVELLKGKPTILRRLLINILVLDKSCACIPVLEALGAKVTQSSSTSLKSDNTPDLVVVGRISTCKEVRKTLQDTPVVFISSNEKATEKAYSLGCIDVMTEDEAFQRFSRLISYATIREASKVLSRFLEKPQ